MLPTASHEDVGSYRKSSQALKLLRIDTHYSVHFVILTGYFNIRRLLTMASKSSSHLLYSSGSVVQHTPQTVLPTRRNICTYCNVGSPGKTLRDTRIVAVLLSTVVLTRDTS